MHSESTLKRREEARALQELRETKGTHSSFARSAVGLRGVLASLFLVMSPAAFSAEDQQLWQIQKVLASKK
jgi:hypothetical protein